MHADEHFLAVLDDMESCLASRNPYHLIRSMGLVRKLIIDSHGLVAQVNRERRLDVRFDVIPWAPMPASLPQPEFAFAIGEGKDFPGARGRVQVKASQLLGLNAGVIHGEVFSVQDLVEYGAYVLGGVHAGQAKSAAHRALAAKDDQFALMRQGIVLTFLANIVRIVLDGLHPLRVAVLLSPNRT